ncbi:hypothetical protein OV450_1469 [Actinobacteria bacterium OV450]|nr:hypothetical protein OV450_1469 [Actinobacteria bacterium OV450]
MEYLAGAALVGAATGIVLANSDPTIGDSITDAIALGIAAASLVALRVARRWNEGPAQPPPSTASSQGACACGSADRASQAEEALAAEREAHAGTQGSYVALAEEYNLLVQKILQERADRAVPRPVPQGRPHLTVSNSGLPTPRDALRRDTPSR